MDTNYVIRAIARIGREDIFLFVIGGDDITPYLKMARELGVGNKIVFTGKVDEGISRFYKAGDVFVLPTSYEAFGLVCLEAMASGLPVLATRVGGIKEYLKDGDNGFFIEQEVSSIANSMELLHNNYELRSEMGQKGRLTAQAYSWERIGIMYLELCREVEGMKDS